MVDHLCLIVDDEQAIRMFVRAILEKERIRCLEAGTALEALRIVKNLDGRLDLIVTDVKMPGDMDGIDLAYSVSASFPGIAMILISGSAEDNDVQNAASVFKLIRKPFTIATIQNAIRESLTRIRATG